MKLNRFVHYEPIDEEKGILYNAYNNKSLLIDAKLLSLIEQYKDSIHNLKHIYPALFKRLESDHYIVDSSINEPLEAIKRIKETLDNDTELRLTVNPTMDCNLRCWYCYEEHIKGSKMSDETLSAIIKFVERNLDSKPIKNVLLSFFGGEPLLYLNKVVTPVTEAIDAMCKNRHVGISLMFTTNGVLINRNFLLGLKERNINVSFQIPFDGNQYLHDQTKQLASGNGTYRIVINNINEILSFGMRVNVRCNYSIDNITSFTELMSSIKSLSNYDNRLCSFSLQKIWQSDESKELDMKVSDVINWAKENGIISESAETMIPMHCYADYSNSYVINYDGHIYKCTARKFSTQNSIGVMNPNGEIVLNRSKDFYLNKRFYNDCYRCTILPICTICHQTHIKNDSDKCPYHITEDEKIKQIKHHIRVSNKSLFNV